MQKINDTQKLIELFIRNWYNYFVVYKPIGLEARDDANGQSIIKKTDYSRC
jgi:hypothetical protein